MYTCIIVSGSHWVANLIHFLLQSGPLDEIKSLTPVPLMELIPEDVAEVMPNPRLFHSHALPIALPSSVFKRDRKIIMTIRNPKDTAVSTFYHVKKDPFMGPLSILWCDFIECWIKGLCKLYFPRQCESVQKIFRHFRTIFILVYHHSMHS